MKTKNVMFFGALCSLVLFVTSCSKDSINLNPEIESKKASNVWTETGNPKLSEEPTFYQISGTNTFQFDGSITGLGNASEATITIEASILVDPSCHNPGNGDVVKGVSKPVTKPVTKTYQLTNGKFDFSVHTDPITTDDLGGGLCPNGNWITEIDNVTLLSYTIKLNGVYFYSKTIN